LFLSGSSTCVLLAQGILQSSNLNHHHHPLVLFFLLAEFVFVFGFG